MSIYIITIRIYIYTYFHVYKCARVKRNVKTKNKTFSYYYKKNSPAISTEFIKTQNIFVIMVWKKKKKNNNWPVVFIKKKKKPYNANSIEMQKKKNNSHKKHNFFFFLNNYNRNNSLDTSVTVCRPIAAVTPVVRV